MKELIYISLILFILFSNASNSQKLLPTADYECLKGFIETFSITHYQPNATGFYNFCGGYIPSQYYTITCQTETQTQTNYISGLILSDPGTVPPRAVTLSDFTCFTSLSTLKLSNFLIDTALFYGKISESLSEITFDLVKGISTISQNLPAYKKITISTKPSLTGINFKMSYINNIKSFTLDASNTTIEVDQDAIKTNLTEFLLYSTKIFPDFTGYDFQNLLIRIESDFDSTSFINFDRIRATSPQSTVKIDFVTGTSNIPLFFGNNPNISRLTIEGANIVPTSIVDISANSNYSILSFIRMPSFSFNGQIPIIVKNTTSLKYSYGNFPQVPNFDSLSLLAITNSNMGGPLPINNGSIKYIDFSSNSLTGTVDSSWCTVELSLSINQLSGQLPSCFQCYAQNPGNVYTSFYGNYQLLNFPAGINDGCPTHAPQVKKITESTLSVYGIDLGFTYNNIKVNNTGCKSPVMVTRGREFTCTSSNYIGIKYINIIFVIPSRNLTFALESTSPKPTSVQVSQNTITIQGSYFSSYIGQSVQNITIGGVECITIDTSFYQIICSTSQSIPSSLQSNQLLTIVNANETKKLYINTLDTYNNNVQCHVNCGLNDKGICDLSNGTCICDNGFVGVDCMSLAIACPSINSQDCSGWGICNYETGMCGCDSSHQGNDCNLPYIDCPYQCMNGGMCDTIVGKCNCTKEIWSGETCEIPYHYISSVIPSTVKGGEASFIGLFGNLSDLLTVKIDNLDCPIISNSTEIIKCMAPAGTGIHSINITQNNIIYIGKDLYKYVEIESSLSCPNNCYNSYSQGTCTIENGISFCVCNKGYASHDCSAIVDNSNGNSSSPNTAIDSGKGLTNITFEKTQFQIYFKSLVEVDYNDNIINEYSLQRNWSVNKSLNIHRFNQTIQKDGDCIVSMVVEEITQENGKLYEFADINYKIEKGSIKLSISIANYKYKSALNRLKLQFLSSVSDNQPPPELSCNSQDTELDISNYNDKYAYNYVKISKDSIVFSGRFINRVLSDGVQTFLSSTVSTVSRNSVLVSLDLPHCTKNCLIDPDFSVLLSTEFKSDCGITDKRKSYVIPVAVVASVVGACILSGSAYLIYRKKFVENQLKKKLAALRLK